MMGKAVCFSMCLFLLTGAVSWGQGQGDLRRDRSSSDEAWTAMDRAFDVQQGQQMSLEDEYYLGRAVAASILSSYRPYTGNPALSRYLNLICQSIVINSPQYATFNGYYVIILDSQEYNAFASPGGHILITKGLVEAAGSEDALAALIAHELAHIMLRHAAAIIEHMSLANEMGVLADRAAAMSGNTPAARKALEMRSSSAAIVDTMMKNGYSQAHEFEADRKALELLSAAGYDPRGLLEILQVLQRVQPSQRGGFNSTHPSPSQRIANVNASIGRASSGQSRSARDVRFENQ